MREIINTFTIGAAPAFVKAGPRGLGRAVPPGAAVFALPIRTYLNGEEKPL